MCTAVGSNQPLNGNNQPRKENQMRRWTLAVIFGVLLLVSAVAAVAVGPASVHRVSGQASSPEARPAAASTPVTVREVLATGQPPAAPGQTLDLVRYTIPPGTTLSVHIHPGMQIAWVASGELTYHVLKGEVQIGRAANASAGAPGSPEILAAGESTILYQGDWVVEVPGAVHYGENLGSAPLVLWAATLLQTEEPAAIPVNAEGTPVA
jgi:quercetin dioxygenase-like cupin family protein